MKQLRMSQPNKEAAANQGRLASIVVHCPYCHSFDVSLYTPLSEYYKSKFAIYGKCRNCNQAFNARELDETR